MLPELKSAEVARPPLVPGALAQPHAVRSVRETLRRWWGIELAFAGSVAEVESKSIAISPENRICTACLSDKEGGRRCAESIRKAVAAGRPGVAGPCHLGFDVVDVDRAHRADLAPYARVPTALAAARDARSGRTRNRIGVTEPG